MYIVLHDNPWVIPLGKKFKTQADLIWKDDQGNIIKTVNLKIDLERPKTDDQCATIKIYAYVTTGVVITLILTIVVIVLLVK